MSATETKISAAEWLEVRDHLAAEIRPATSVQAPTRIAIAERLLRAGFIDVAAVLDAIHPPKSVDPKWKNPSKGAVVLGTDTLTAKEATL